MIEMDEILEQVQRNNPEWTISSVAGLENIVGELHDHWLDIRDIERPTLVNQAYLEYWAALSLLAKRENKF